MKTVKKLLFYAFFEGKMMEMCGDVLEALGKSVRRSLRQVGLTKVVMRISLAKALLELVGLEKSKYPWEMYADFPAPKTTWGALSRAQMFQKSLEKRSRNIGALEVGDMDNAFFAEVCDGEISVQESVKSREQSKTCVPKMQASRHISSPDIVDSVQFVRVALDKNPVQESIGNVVLPETLKQPEDQVVIVGQVEDRQEENKTALENAKDEINRFVQQMQNKLSFDFQEDDRRHYRQEEKREWVRDANAHTVGVYAFALLLFLSVASSAYILVPFLDAEVKVQNFTEKETNVTNGLTLLAYEDRTQDEITSEAELDAGDYSADQFETGNDDLDALATDDLALNHYGDNPPDLSVIDWWDDDADTVTNYAWRYRRCFDVDNSSSADDMIQYQIYLDIDTATLVSAGEMLTNGDDIRFVNEDEDLLPYFIADDMNSTSTKIWVQIDEIPAGDTEPICMYYGNTGATDASSREDVFTYDAAKPIYYVVSDTADGSITDFASYSDDNDITVSGYAGTLDAVEFVSHPSAVGSLSEVSAVSVTHPINASYQSSGLDNLAPVAAAGTSFVYRTDRYTNEFSIISPWCAASLTFENGSGNNILDTASATSSPFALAAGSSLTITTNDTAANGLPNNDVVIIEEVGGDCPVLITHHSTTGGDSYTMYPAANEWYGVGSGSFNVGILQDTTSVTVYKSDGTTVGPTLYNRGDGFSINDAGSQGSEVAHRVVADKPVGAQARGDGDGGDAVTFLPVGELGYRYYVADVSQYIAVATAAGVTTTVDLYHDGTSCGTGTPDDTATVTPTGNFPGKVYFGSTTDGDNIPAGACIVADNPVYAYNEYSAAEDEHNLWNEKQNRQFISPAPTYTVGTEEIGQWLIDGTNRWIRRVPVTINNTATAAIDEYQMSIDLGTDVATLFGETQIDGGDIRVAGALGDGSDNQKYFLESFSDVAQTGTLWVQSPAVSASSSAVFYIYYGPIGADITSFSPLLWVDAADDSTISQTTGALNQLDDKSGNGNDFLAPGGQEPAVATDGIKQVLTFDGVNDEIVDADGIFASGTTYDDMTHFLVYKDLTLGVNDAVFAFDALGAQVSAYLAPWGTQTYWRPASTWAPYTYGGDITDYHVIRLETETTATDQKSIYRDNALVDTTPGGGETLTGDGTQSVIGDWTGSGFNKHMQFAEMITMPAAVSAADQATIEQYLREKWITRPSTALTTTGSYDALWQTTTPKPNYYVVDELAVPVGLVNIISFANGNTVEMGADTSAADEGIIITVPSSVGVSDTDIYTVTGPLSIGYDGDTTDAALPISYAGEEFLMRVGRNTDNFSFFAPFEDASVQIQQSSGAGYTTLQTVAVAAGSAVHVAQDITNNTAFKIISDEPILAFHRNDSNDSKILYPAEKAFVDSTGKYEIYGVAANSLQLAASTSTTVDIYRSDGSSDLGVVIDGTDDFTYAEPGGGGAQGTARGYRIVSDDPIGASSYADSDGGETVIFLPQREFSDEYVLPNPAQYMSIVTRDPSIECRVFDETGAAVTTGPAAMDNIPPQTSGSEALPFPNQIHIGGDDTADPAFFSAGYRLECDEPVYVYYEHHLDSAITDETSWLTWPQARTRNYIEPTVADLDAADEQGLYYESGFGGSSGVATAEYTFDTSVETYAEHTYWRDILWDETITDRGALGSVQQIKIETAYADSPSCSTATYSSYQEATGTTTLSTSTDTSPPFHDITSNTKKALIVEEMNDHDCLRVRITLQTGDTALTPTLPNFTLGYYVPDLLEGQLSTPQIDVAGTVGVADERFRIAKALTGDTGLNGSQSNLTFSSVSNAAPFASADFELLELSTDTINPQFTFPAFPAGELTAGTSSPLDASNDLAIYYIGQRTAGSNEQIDMRLNLDILNAGGPSITRDFTLEVEG